MPIAGWLRLDGAPVGPDEARRLADATGAGADEVWREGPIVLIGPAATRGSLRVAADARLDDTGAVAPADAAPPDALARAWSAGEEHGLARIYGDFAVAVWDGATRRLWLTRDPMGCRPLYVVVRPGRFVAFATTARALLALPGVSRRADPDQVAAYLVPWLEDREATFWADIRRVAPGDLWRVDADGVRKRTWWRWEDVPSIGPIDEQAAADGLRTRLSDAVRTRLPAGGFGVALSGGLDSATIAALAREHRRPVRTYSARTDVPSADERPWRRELYASGGFVPNEVFVDDRSPLQDLERVLDAHDEPILDPNLFVVWSLYQQAAADGVRVVLFGVDGDGVVGHGFERLAELAAGGRWGRLLVEARAVARRHHLSWRDVVWRFAVSPHVPDAARRVVRARRPPASARGRGLLRPETAARLVDALPLRYGVAAPTVRDGHVASLRSGLLAYALERNARSAAAFGLEARYPFLDRRVATFCLSLPAEQRLSRGFSRAVLRRATAGLLPDALRWRGDKTDLWPVFERALHRNGLPLIDEAWRYVPHLEPWIDRRAADAALERFRARGRGIDAFLVWQVATLALWFEKHRVSA